MATINNLKKEKMFHRAISHIITEEVNNSSVSYPTVTDVKLSGDGSHLKVFLSFENNKEASLESLNKVKGFIRKMLSQRVQIRKIPEIHFKLDKSIDEGKKIDQILENIRNNK